MNTKKRIIRLVLGWVSLILGLLGLVLPVLQGILFLAIGVLLLSPDVPLFRKLLKWIKKHHPKVARKADKITDRIED